MKTSLDLHLIDSDPLFLPPSRSFSLQDELLEDGRVGRKEKSLGELCRKFLSIYGKEGKDLLMLDQCTRELGVERRRIYDIINILESFCVIRRQAKNSYKWRGIDRIVISIEAQIVSNVFDLAGAIPGIRETQLSPPNPDFSQQLRE